MKTFIPDLAGLTVIAVLMTAIVCACGASAASVTATTAQQADFGAYAAEEQACVQMAVATDAGLMGADSCIAAVKSRWCGPGAPLNGYCAGQSLDAGGQ